MKVQATKLGFIHGRRKYPGEVFVVSEKEFSARWMIDLDASKEAEPSPKPEALEKGKGKKGREARAAASSGDAEVI